jgi:ubiquinone/menaquinone biosynthesis C-methylase UbiE
MNLVPDKARAYAETYRILKPGGHFSVSDIVIQGNLPQSLRSAAELYVGCVSGAVNKDAYLGIIKSAGFKDVIIQKERKIDLADELLDQYLDDTQKSLFHESGVGIYSMTVFAKKPEESCCGSNCCD